MCNSAKEHRRLIANTPDLDTLEGYDNRHRRVLKKAHAEQGGLCFWCRDPTPLWWEITTEEFIKVGKMKIATREHLTPQSNGGEHTIDNIACACYDCNSVRGTIPVNQFKWVSADPERIKRLKKKRAQKKQERDIAKGESRKARRRAHQQRMNDSAAKKAKRAAEKKARVDEAEYNYMMKLGKKMRDSIIDDDNRIEEYRCQERPNNCQKTAKILNFA